LLIPIASIHRILYAPPPKPVEPPWARSRTLGIVYFISAAKNSDYPIKIGFCASNVEKRRVELQIANPYLLEVLATNLATYAQEQAIISHFLTIGLSVNGFTEYRLYSPH
jgi:hypothetical protein